MPKPKQSQVVQSKVPNNALKQPLGSHEERTMEGDPTTGKLQGLSKPEVQLSPQTAPKYFHFGYTNVGTEHKTSMVVENFLGVEAAGPMRRVLAHVIGAALEPALSPDLSHIQPRIETLQAMKPATLVEAQLCAQMIATNDLAMHLFKLKYKPDGTSFYDVETVEFGTKLMKLFLEQADMLQKLKGQSGQQKVTVEHVTVNAGGQAIVGNVEGAVRRGGRGDAERSER